MTKRRNHQHTSFENDCIWVVCSQFDKAQFFIWFLWAFYPKNLPHFLHMWKNNVYWYCITFEHSSTQKDAKKWNSNDKKYVLTNQVKFKMITLWHTHCSPLGWDVVKYRLCFQNGTPNTHLNSNSKLYFRILIAI